MSYLNNLLRKVNLNILDESQSHPYIAIDLIKH